MVISTGTNFPSWPVLLGGGAPEDMLKTFQDSKTVKMWQVSVSSLKNKPRCYPQQRLGNIFQFCGHINGKIIKKPHRRLSRNTALELCPEPPAPEPSRNPWFGTLPRNLPGTGGSEPAPEPSRNLPEPAPGKPPRNRPGAYIGKDPIAKAVGETRKLQKKVLLSPIWKGCFINN